MITRLLSLVTVYLSLFDDEIIGVQRLGAAQWLLEAQRVALDALGEDDAVLVAEVEQHVNRLGVVLRRGARVFEDAFAFAVGVAPKGSS